MKLDNARDLSPDPKNLGVEMVIRMRLTPMNDDLVANREDLLKEVVLALDGHEIFVNLLKEDEEDIPYMIETISGETFIDREAQIKHLEEYSAEFEAYLGTRTSVREYFATYGHAPGLYEQLCQNLEIEPR